MKKGVIIIIIINLFMLPILLLSQTNISPSAPAASAYSYSGTMGDAEQLRIYTYIWGQVKKPGLYIVPDDTNLLALLSLAGGPTEQAKLSKIRIVRPTKGGKKIIWVNIKEYLETGNQELIPVLQPGDTIIVSGTIFYAFSKTADFLAKVAAVLGVYNLFINLKD